MRSRLLGTLLSLATIVGFGGPGQAQTFPTRPVTLIVPFPAGGATDVALRSLASATEKHLGQSIMIENRPGANGAVAAIQMAATASPDGHVVAQIPRSVFRYPFMTKTTFDPIADLTYVIGVSGYTFGVAVRADASWTTLQELLADAKAGPGKINYGTTGAGSSQHIIMEDIAKLRSIKWTHVPFKGDADMLNTLLGGHIQAVAGSTAWGPLVDAGKLRLLATFGEVRTKSWPTVSTLKDNGIDMVMTSPYGIAGPKGMDPKVVAVLHDAFKKGLDEPAFRATLAKLDQEPWYQSSDDYRAYVLRDMPEVKRSVEEFGLRPE
jgi:tripartite-type tricarboxylate transporter receptor subunit TctC